jgi:hypothetical protein
VNGRTVSSLIFSKHLSANAGWGTYLKDSVPKFIKRLARHWFPLEYDAYNRHKWRAMDPYARVGEASTYPAKVPVNLGIVAEFAHGHRYYIGACREMGVPYKVLDLSGPGWVDIVRTCGCDAFLVCPSCELSVWKRMYDERLRTMVEDLGKIIYPTYKELWFYESKRRMGYWLQAHGVPHPQTWVFYNCDDALEFAHSTQFPIVVKNDFGSAASGVRIMRSTLQLVRYVKHCFRKGVVGRNEDPRDCQWGSVMFQEYLPDVREWRMAVVGGSYFGYEKLKCGDFHSGSLRRAYSRPSDEILFFTRRVMEEGGFTSMALDVFETKGKRYLVNELQSLFGMSRPEMCVVDGQAGRMVFQPHPQSWVFEGGDFCRNNLCNLRVQTLLTTLCGQEATKNETLTMME